MDDYHGLLAPEKCRDSMLKIIKRVAMLREDNELLVWRRGGWRNFPSAVGRDRFFDSVFNGGDGENLT